MDELTFSFIVPVYNTEEHYLRKCLDSILAVHNCSFEILIINDGSTTVETCNLLNEYKKYPNINIVIKENGGVSSARNVGLSTAKGKYIVFVDSDDFIDPRKFESVYSTVIGTPDIDFFAFTHTDVDINGNGRFSEGDNSGDIYICYSIFDLWQESHKHNASIIRESVWGKVFRRDKIKTLLFDTDLAFGEDALFVLEAWNETKKIMGCNIAFYNYRSESESVTNKYRPKILSQSIQRDEKIGQF
ncbi:MAG: glycosyltransferase [Clostridiales bacterium]|nr:glycosyltransferase [Clostridiales bacterium]